MDINVALFYFINHTLENPVFNIIMPSITNIGGFIGIILILFLIIIFAHLKNNKRLRNIALLALISLLVSGIFVVFVKNLIHEPRPFVSLADVHLLIMENDPNSFPSGHTASTFSVVMIFVLNMKKIFKKYYIAISIITVVFAFLIAFSRVYVGVHYPSDVIVGGIIGTVMALLVNKVNEVLSIIKF